MDTQQRLQFLPEEIIFEIIKKMQTLDALNFCKALGLQGLEKIIMKNIDLYTYKNFELRDIEPIDNLIIYEYVVTLNINGLYWIEASILRDFLKKLVNLKNLYALSSSISLDDEDLILYDQRQLKKLAVTKLYERKILQHVVTSLEVLYLQTNSNKLPIKIKSIFPNVKNVWLDFGGSPTWTVLTEAMINQNETQYLMHYNLQINSIFSYKKPNFGSACTASDAEGILAKCVNFDELSLNHAQYSCTQEFIKISKEILTFNNVRFLKKLAINTCFLHCNLCTNNSLTEEEIWFKQNHKKNHSPDNFLADLKFLEVLEVRFCQCSNFVSCFTNYYAISKLSELRTLVLEIPKYTDGKFLVTIVRRCKNLEVLKIRTSNRRKALMHNIAESMYHGNSLKDLRLDLYNSVLAITMILKALVTLDSSKLQRLAFISRSLKESVDEFGSLFSRLIFKNPRVIFFAIDVRDISNEFFKIIYTTFQELQDKRRIFCINKLNYKLNYGMLPFIHYNEMIVEHSNVTTVKKFELFKESEIQV